MSERECDRATARIAPPEPHLSVYGKIAEQQLLELEERYSNITLDKYVIMPNHIHMIITITPIDIDATKENGTSSSHCGSVTLAF